MSNQQQLKLPPISQQPFKIPNDTELLLDEQFSELRTNAKGAKIHQKMTASCRNPLKRFDKFQTAVDDKYIPLNNYSQKDKKVIESALELIQHRKKNKDLMTQKETLYEVLQQKKEMFLVTMTHGIIEKEIHNLKDQSLDRERALKQSDQILELDMRDFQTFQQKQKNQTRGIQQKYQKLVQRRLLKQQEIKSKQITFNSLRAEKSRNQENISSYEKYKKFLNQLPQNQWVQEQEAKKRKKLVEFRSKLYEEWLRENKKERGEKSDREFDVYFQKLRNSGENQEIQQILNNQDMYFTEAHELIEYFNNLQQANLFCIQNVQTEQQKLQELLAKSQSRQKQLKEKYTFQQEHKKNLQKNLLELENQIKVLKKRKEQNSALDGKDSNNVRIMIGNQYQNMKESMTAQYLPEIQHNAESLSILSGIQICMQRLWQRVVQCHDQNPALIKSIKTAYEKNKTKQKREQAAKNSREEQMLRKQRNMNKKQPTAKIIGRMDMKRSAPYERQIKKTKEIKNKDENDDLQYLVQ